VTVRGGHIGFLEGIWPMGKDQYMSRIFAEFFAATLFDHSKEFAETKKKIC
jgi:predicted alpha/beta-fold hydrolase